MIELKKLAEMLEKDDEARARIVDILTTEIAVRSRNLIVEAVLKEVATKDDIEKLRNELRKEIKDVENILKNEIKETEERLKKDLKEYIDIKITSLVKRLDILSRFMLRTFIGIFLTLVSVILAKLL